MYQWLSIGRQNADQILNPESSSSTLHIQNFSTLKIVLSNVSTREFFLPQKSLHCTKDDYPVAADDELVREAISTRWEDVHHLPLFRIHYYARFVYKCEEIVRSRERIHSSDWSVYFCRLRWWMKGIQTWEIKYNWHTQWMQFLRNSYLRLYLTSKGNNA